jgi:hypothetical protein
VLHRDGRGIRVKTIDKSAGKPGASGEPSEGAEADTRTFESKFTVARIPVPAFKVTVGMASKDYDKRVALPSSGAPMKAMVEAFVSNVGFSGLPEILQTPGYTKAVPTGIRWTAKELTPSADQVLKGKALETFRRAPQNGSGGIRVFEFARPEGGRLMAVYETVAKGSSRQGQMSIFAPNGEFINFGFQPYGSPGPWVWQDEAKQYGLKPFRTSAVVE